jgi:hypothetical protein
MKVHARYHCGPLKLMEEELDPTIVTGWKDTIFNSIIRDE